MKYNVDTSLSIRKIDTEVFIFERKSSIIHTLNCTGARIFELLKSGIDSEHIPDLIIEEYQISIDVAKKDVNKYVEELESKRIIENAK